jgi:hypothetical protein
MIARQREWLAKPYLDKKGRPLSPAPRPAGGKMHVAFPKAKPKAVQAGEGFDEEAKALSRELGIDPADMERYVKLMRER